ncbi:hypothetical protein [Nocardia sp. NPDC050175]|uniref:hypothetical protein n=1 Tax=Nocardia sp. NPDC050175 TaxID=3364317 RepID=UPI0037BBEE24
MSTPESASQFQMAVLPGIHDAQVALGSATGVAETAMGGSVSMRTSKVLAGSALAIAAAMQIGMGGMASAGAGESIGIAGVAADSKGEKLTVNVLYTCAEGAKHTKISVVVAEDAKEAKEGEKAADPIEGTGFAAIPVGEDKKSTCDGTMHTVLVDVKPDTGNWSKPGMGTVTVAFSDDIQFNSKNSGLKWVAAD